MKSTLFTIVMLVQTNIIIAQINSSDVIMNTVNTYTSFDYRSKDIKGSIYLNDDFMPAKINDDNRIISVRYDAYRDQMEIKKDNDIYYLPKQTNYFLKFLTDNKIYRVYKNNEKDGFFLMIHNDKKIQLLLKEKIELLEEIKPKNGYEKYKPAELKKVKNNFYFGFNDNSTKNIPKNKKELLELFPSQNNELEKYIKANKIKLSKQDDLIKLTSYLNSILE